MSDEPKFDQKFALDRFRQWHFWWLIVFSFLLIITFVYYLPSRFLQQVAVEEAEHGEEEDNHGHEEEMPINGEMRKHMEEFMSSNADIDEMVEHMTEEHMITEEQAREMIDEMMGNEEHMTEEGKMMMDEHEDDEHSEEGRQALYFEEGAVKQGLAINLNINPVPYNVGVPLSMSFFVNQKPESIPVPADQLQIEHEKLMHVIGVRSDMNEFFHIHPVRGKMPLSAASADAPKAHRTSNGTGPTKEEATFTITRAFNKPGLYKIWSEIKKNGVNYSFGHPEVNINGSGSREEKKVSFSRNVITGPRYAEGSGEASNYQVSMEMSDTAVKGREVDLSFDIHSLTGMEIEVEQFLGADMHLSIIKDDWSQFIHTHPVRGKTSKMSADMPLASRTSNGTHPEEVNNSHSQIERIVNTAFAHGGVEDEPAGATDEHQTASSGDEVITFHVTFPEAGLYKAFAQFRPKGIDLPSDEALLAEFWIQVEEKVERQSSFPVSQWWGLLIISVVLIAGLSWVVNRYLKVKPEDVKVK